MMPACVAEGMARRNSRKAASFSGVNVNTIRKMEWKGAATLTSGLSTIRRVQSALEAAGVEFQNHNRPGVRLKEPR
jgi:hypothetical protein